MKRNVVPVWHMPNYEQLAIIKQMANERFLGLKLSPTNIESIKHYINTQVGYLIATGQWVTKSMYFDKHITYKEIEVRGDEHNLSDLRIIPVWEYEEE